MNVASSPLSSIGQLDGIKIRLDRQGERVWKEMITMIPLPPPPPPLPPSPSPPPYQSLVSCLVDVRISSKVSRQ